MIESWRCEICGDMRPDAQISVHKNDRSVEHGLPEGSFVENIKYCNDRLSCTYAARVFNLNEIAERRKDGRFSSVS